MIAALTGFATGFSLILAIGAQNAFVLRQGLQRSHVFAVALFCAMSDAILVTAGVFGFGALIEAVPWLPSAMAAFGICFLIYYGIGRLRAAWDGSYEMELEGRTLPLRETLLTAAAFTWLNPHVYLDTVILLGSISVPFADARILFWLGAVTASFVFFFSLGYGARFLAPIMQTSKAWRILDIIIALVMFGIAAKLLVYLLP